MSYLFSAINIKKDHSTQSLFGLDHEKKTINTFCNFIWSPEWKEHAKLLRFMPTILLYGSPGTGKTSLLKNLAHETIDDSFKYYRESLDLLVNKNLGETSKNIKSLFEELKEQAKCGKKVFLQLDDIDSLLSSRYIANESSGIRRSVNTFLIQLDEMNVEMDTFNYPPIISATTNMFDHLDSAVKRRFSLKLKIIPTLEEKDIRNLIKPIVNIINKNITIDYAKIKNIIIKNMLAPADLILAMQNVFLLNKMNNNFSMSLLINEIEKIESSHYTFENQRITFSQMNKDKPCAKKVLDEKQ